MRCDTISTDESRQVDPVRSGPDDARLNQRYRRSLGITGRVCDHQEQGNQGRDLADVAADILTDEELGFWHRRRKSEEAVMQFLEMMNSGDEVTYVVTLRSPELFNFSNYYADSIGVVMDALSHNAEDAHVDLAKASSQYLHGQPATAAVWKGLQKMNRRKDIYYSIAWRMDDENIARFDFSDNYKESCARHDLAKCLAELFEQELEEARSEEYE